MDEELFSDDLDALLAEMDQDLEQALSDSEYEEEAGPEPMDDDDLQGYLAGIVQRAVQENEDASGDRVEAIRRYRGEAFGNEVPGRSQYVSRDTHDTIRVIMPQLMRIFFGGERAVEFAPNTPEQGPMADQVTDYITGPVMQLDNNGFMEWRSAMHDALLQRDGVVKWWWESTQELDELEHFTGVPLMDWSALVSSPEVGEVVGEMIDPITQTVSGTLRRYRSGGRLRFQALPPEEFGVEPGARSVEDAKVVFHRRYLTVSELVQMGLEWDEVIDHVAMGDEMALSLDRMEREEALVSPMPPVNVPDALKKVLTTEVYCEVDYDGDGVVELRKVLMLGDSYEVVRNLEWDEKPFAHLCPDPDPHRWTGQSVYDLVKDIERIKSKVWRAIFDSLALAVNPRMGVVQSQVNMDDVLNTEIGAPIRMDAPGMVMPFTTPFVGKEAFPVLEAMDQTKETRTGQLRAGQGLDPDVLQSTTQMAVDMTAQAAQQQIEMIARIFAETGFKTFFRGVLRSIHKNQDQARMMKHRGSWVPVQPGQWDPNLSVTVNVGLGTGLPAQRAQILMGVAGKVEALMSQLGPGNPVAGLGRYRNILAKVLELSGIKDPTPYLAPIETDWQPPPPPPPSGPTPEEMFAQAEMLKAQANAQKVQSEAQERQAKLALDRLKALLEDNRDRDKIEVDAVLKAAEIESRYSAAVDTEALKQKAQSRGEA